jgi:hypothetical protein
MLGLGCGEEPEAILSNAHYDSETLILSDPRQSSWKAERFLGAAEFYLSREQDKSDKHSHKPGASLQFVFFPQLPLVPH